MRQTKNKGYTLFEVMVVMSISATMFIIAAAAFSGRQEQVQFSQAVRDFDARLQDAVNDVTTGYFSNSGNYKCEVSNPTNSASSPSFSAAGASDKQGTSDDCVFIGKVLQFHPSGTNESTVNVFNVIGRRNNDLGLSVNDLDESNPVAAGAGANPANELQTIELDWGLRVTKVQNGAGPAQQFGAIGFMTSFSNSVVTAVDTITVSANNSVRVGGIPNTSLSSTNLATAVSRISNIGESEFTGNNGSGLITICLESSGRTKKAAVVIGRAGGADTTIQFDDYDTSICT